MIASLTPSQALTTLKTSILELASVAPIDLTNFKFAISLRVAVFLIGGLFLTWAFWPVKAGTVARAKYKGHMTPRQVIQYITSETAWAAQRRSQVRNLNKRNNTNDTYSLFGEAWLEFQRHACDSATELRVWGLMNGEGEPMLIPSSFWITNNFAFRETISGEEHRTSPFANKSKRPNSDFMYYSELRIERDGVQKTWRRMWNPIAIFRERKRQKDQLAALKLLGF